VDRIDAILDANHVVVPAGHIDLRVDLPSSLAEPFTQAISTSLERTNVPAVRVGEVARDLEAQTYFKSARKLYATMTAPEKSRLQALKAVYYDATPLPKHLCSAMDIIGHFESKLGKIEVSYPELVFKRWVAKGLNCSTQAGFDQATNPAESMVWRDAVSKRYLNDLADRRMQHLCNVAFDYHGIQVKPSRPPNTAAGYTALSDHYPDIEEMRNLVAFLMQDETGYVAGNALHRSRNINDVFNHLHVNIAPNNYRNNGLMHGFGDFSADYLMNTHPHVTSVFEIGECPNAEKGYGAQIVRSQDVTAHFELPLADSDKAIGFMFNPSTGFRINPRFVAYNRRRMKEEAFDFASQDLKHFANQ
jgi:hypothetical protein